MANEKYVFHKTVEFDSEFALFDWFYEYQIHSNYAFSIKNSASLKNVILKKLPCNPKLGYDEIRFTCIHEGQFKSKGNNQRKRKSLKRGCPAFLQFRTSRNGKEKLVITEFHLEHNHQCEEEFVVEKHVTRMKNGKNKQKEQRERLLGDEKEVLPADEELNKKSINNPKTVFPSRKAMSQDEGEDISDVSTSAEGVRSSKLHKENRNLLMTPENVAGTSTSSPDENLHLSDIADISLSSFGVRPEELVLLGDVMFNDTGAEMTVTTYTSLSRSAMITEAKIPCASLTPGDENCRKNSVTLDHYKTVPPPDDYPSDTPHHPQAKDNFDTPQLDSAREIPLVQAATESDCQLEVPCSEQIPQAVVPHRDDKTGDKGQHSPGIIVPIHQNVHDSNDCSKEISDSTTLDSHNNSSPLNDLSQEILLNPQAKDNFDALQLDSAKSDCQLEVPSSEQIPQTVPSRDGKTEDKGQHPPGIIPTHQDVHNPSDYSEEISRGAGIGALSTPPISPNKNDGKKLQPKPPGGSSRGPLSPPTPSVHCHQHPERTIDLEDLKFVEKKSRGRPSKGRTTAMGRPIQIRKYTRPSLKSLQDEPTQFKKAIKFSEKLLKDQLSQILDGIISSEILTNLLSGDYQVERKWIEKITIVTLNDAICSDNVSLSSYGKYFKRGALVALKHLIDEKKKHVECGICNNELTTEAIECDSCLKWIDWKCSGLKAAPKGSWFCSSCLDF